MINMSIIDKAYKTAVKDLRENYYPLGIITGNLRRTYWSWDSFFASFGANRLKDFEIVKKNLLLYLKYQRKDGLLPKRISSPLYYLSTIGFKPRWNLLFPVYHGSYFISPSVTQNIIFIIACYDYIVQSKDKKFLEDNYNKILKAMVWISKQDKDNDFLIDEGFGANWAESALKHGEVMFTNICYFKALINFSKIAALLKKKDDARGYSKMAENVKKSINKKFWNGNYYIDWIDKKKQDYFSSTGNVLAIVWDVADKKKGIKIQQFIMKNKLDLVPMITNYPSYPWYKSSVFNIIGGLLKYHNGYSWPWIGCFDAIAKHKLGMKKESEQVLKRIARLICKHSTTSEIYNSKGKRIKTWVYQSENRFSWTAGLFILAVNEIIRPKK